MSHGRGETGARALLCELAEQGVTVRHRRGRLVVDAPESTPADLLHRLADAETEVTAEIQAHPGLPGPRPTESAVPQGNAFELTDLQGAYQVGEADFPELRTPAYIAHGFEVPDLDPARLRLALRAVLAKHEMLRVRLEESGLQRVAPLADEWSPVSVDWRHLAGEQARAAFGRERATAARWLPALSESPQLASVVYRVQDSAFVLLCLRLFVLDARSIGLVCRDLADSYMGKDIGPTGPAGAFQRYVAAVVDHRGSQAYRNAVAHWQRLAGRLPSGTRAADAGAAGRGGVREGSAPTGRAALGTTASTCRGRRHFRQYRAVRGVRGGAAALVRTVKILPDRIGVDAGVAGVVRARVAGPRRELRHHAAA